MTRNLFPNEQFVAGTIRNSSLLRVVDGLELEVFLDDACTTPADIVDLGLQPITFISVTGSAIQRFYGPDNGIATLYVRVKDDTGNGDPIYAYGVNAGTSGGTSSYIHYQSLPSAAWTINHPLGYPPNITLVTSSGEVVLADIEYPPDESTTKVIVTFAGALAGKAYLS